MVAWLILVAACGGSGTPNTGDDAPDAMPAPDAGPVELDGDGDGVKTPLDCDDGDAAVYPGAPELCDFKPNGCGAAVSDSASTKPGSQRRSSIE